jgi:hypothetical protein
MKQNKQLKFYINDKSYIIELNSESKIYSSTNNEFDMMIIRLKDSQVNDYLEIDENIFEDDSENNYDNESIYILHYANVEEAKDKLDEDSIVETAETKDPTDTPSGFSLKTFRFTLFSNATFEVGTSK